MQVNLSAVMKFAGEVQKDPRLAIKEKSVSGECNFADGQPHITATLEFPQGKLTLASDQPLFFGGGGSAPDPLLYCLFGTASCFAGTMMVIIAQRKLSVDALNITVKNRVNLLRPLGLGDAPVVEGVWIGMTYRGAASEEQMNAVVKEALETCPGAYCLTHPIPVTAEIKKG
ncbi:MAG: OsmC family protein [bacterium]|nr:OsmC family protein [bacterium]